MEWMARHWPRLKPLKGLIHVARNQQLRDHFWNCKAQANPNAKQDFIFQ